MSHDLRSGKPLTHEPRLLAVIDIGATSVRMLIAELSTDGVPHTVESLAQAVNLGKDSFIVGKISRETIEDCVHVLKTYRSKLQEYGIEQLDQIRVVATSAVQEAQNSASFKDRIFIATGFNIDPFDEAELHRVTYLGIQPYLEQFPALLQGQTVICEVGGGSTELIVLQQAQVAFAKTFRLGALRLIKTLEAFRAPLVQSRQLMETQIDKTIFPLLENIDQQQTTEIVTMGGEMRLAASRIHVKNGTRSSTVSQDAFIKVSLADLREFTETVFKLTPDVLVAKYQLAIPEAESLGPALLTNIKIANLLGVEHVLVADVNLRDGLIKEMTSQRRWLGEAEDQVFNSAIALGRKFSFDEPHANRVANLAVSIFEQTLDLHQLDGRWEAILQMAALLHEIGLSINERSYHKHSMYIIRNSVIFGVSEMDLALVAMVARYHRRATPQPSHMGYSGLDRTSRIAVTKLASILRIAVTLDASRSQRIEDIRCRMEGNRFVIEVGHLQNLSLERLELRREQSVFENIFGLCPEIRQIKRDV